MSDQIGFIGLGIMGKPMARNLEKAGYKLLIQNRSQDDVDQLLSESNNFTAVSNAREVAEKTTTIITMLPDSGDVQDVVFGSDGLMAGLQPGTLLIDMSTISPKVSIDVNQAMREVGSSALDAPVSGGEQGAIDGVLSIMVGGSAADFDRAMPLFEAMGKTIVHVGEAGAGQVVKACNQIVVAMHYAAASEALVLGAKAGVDPAKIVQVLTGGLAGSKVLEMKGPKMVDRSFAPGFRVDLHRKDLNIAMQAGREFGVALPGGAVVTQLFEALAANGGGDLDHSALITVYEKLADFEVEAKA